MKITQLRRDLSAASIEGKGNKIKDLSGLDKPKDAVEVIIMYLALDVIRGNGLAGPALASLKEWRSAKDPL
jgi:hypothetical protein